MNRIILATLILTTLGCKPEAEKFNGHFSTKLFFQKEATKLNQKQTKVLKMVELNGEFDTVELDQLSWMREFSPFISADINKAAYIGKYKIEEIAQPPFRKLSYIALEDNLPLRKMEVEYTANDTFNISIIMQEKNTLYTRNLQLEYNAKEGYSIDEERIMRISKSNKTKVVVKFLN